MATSEDFLFPVLQQHDVPGGQHHPSPNPLLPYFSEPHHLHPLAAVPLARTTSVLKRSKTAGQVELSSQQWFPPFGNLKLSDSNSKLSASDGGAHTDHTPSLGSSPLSASLNSQQWASVQRSAASGPALGHSLAQPGTSPSSRFRAPTPGFPQLQQRHGTPFEEEQPPTRACVSMDGRSMGGSGCCTDRSSSCSTWGEGRSVSLGRVHRVTLPPLTSQDDSSPEAIERAKNVGRAGTPSRFHSKQWPKTLPGPGLSPAEELLGTSALRSASNMISDFSPRIHKEMTKNTAPVSGAPDPLAIWVAKQRVREAAAEAKMQGQGLGSSQGLSQSQPKRRLRESSQGDYGDGPIELEGRESTGLIDFINKTMGTAVGPDGRPYMIPLWKQEVMEAGDRHLREAQREAAGSPLGTRPPEPTTAGGRPIFVPKKQGRAVGWASTVDFMESPPVLRDAVTGWPLAHWVPSRSPTPH